MMGMKLQEIKIKVTTIADGSGSNTSGRATFGLLYAVHWEDTDFDGGVDAVISTQNDLGSQTLLTLTNADADVKYHPRTLVDDEAGVALTGTQGGDRIMNVVAGELKLAVTSGGNTKSGTVILYVFE